MPTELRKLLGSRVFKVGCKVRADLTRLSQNFHHSPDLDDDFILDLKTLSDSRDLLPPSLTSSLQSMLAALLDLFLAKGEHLRLHDLWERDVLDLEHQIYALSDPYASYLITEHILANFEQVPLPTRETQAGTAVDLHTPGSDGTHVAARGIILEERPLRHQATSSCGQTDSIAIQGDNRRVLIEVQEVLLPSAKMLLYTGATDRRRGIRHLTEAARSLSSFGPPTFTLAVEFAQLRFPSARHSRQEASPSDEDLEAQAAEARRRAAELDAMERQEADAPQEGDNDDDGWGQEIQREAEANDLGETENEGDWESIPSATDVVMEAAAQARQ